MATEKTKLVTRFGIDQQTLETRKRFIRLGEDDRRILEELIPWAEEVAPKIAKEFYDWQFSFDRTLAFFEDFAQKGGHSLSSVRRHLEDSQARYFREIFQGARDGWGLTYFENRLHIGSVHDRINLPFKWYIGAYTEYDVLVHRFLTERYPTEPEKVWRIEVAIRRVMNYDTQAIGDSFLMNTLGSIGLSVDSVERPAGGDRTEALVQIKANVETLRKQADAIAAGRFDDEALRSQVPGSLGQTFAAAVDSLQKLLEQARMISEGRLDAEQLDTRVEGMLGETFSQMTENLTNTILRIQTNTQALSQMARELKDVSDALTEGAESTSAQANSASAASEQVSKSIQAIAAAAEQMNSTIREVSRNVTEASKIAGMASKMATETDAIVSKLSESSEQINNVVKVITDIAEQTNLLALNATIEAARAGDAGKGFAVVANEVKELAKETTRSTGEIRSQVKRIQGDTSEAVDAIRKIGDIIAKINDTQTMIAAAVEEQGATTSDIARSIAEAAKGSQEISNNIAAVAKAATSTQTTAGQTTTAAGELGRMTQDLSGSISIFSVKRRTSAPTPAPAYETARGRSTAQSPVRR